MYQYAYDEIVDESAAEARDREAHAFTTSIRLLEAADTCGLGSDQAKEALGFTEELWMILVEDLAHPDNKLSEATRAAIISIGIWVLKEVDRIRCGESKGFLAIAEINAILRDGLK